MSYKPLRRGTRDHEWVIRLHNRGISTLRISRQVGYRPIQIAAIIAHITMGTYRRRRRAGWSPNLLSRKMRIRLMRMIESDWENDRISRSTGIPLSSVPAFKAHVTMETYKGYVGCSKLSD